MDYSLNKRKISLGKLKGKEMFVASSVCQKQRVSFDQLCERMAEDSTVGQADVAAVFLQVPQHSQPTLFAGIHRGRRSARHVPPYVHVKGCGERGRLQAVGVHLQDANSLHSDTGVPPAEECRVLPGGKAGEEEREGRRQEQGWRNRAPIGK